MKIDEWVWQVFLSFYLDQAKHPIRKCYKYTMLYTQQEKPELVDDIPAYCTFTRHVKQDIADSIKVLVEMEKRHLMIAVLHTLRGLMTIWNQMITGLVTTID